MKKEDSHIDPLKGLPKEQPFKVPEGYFETFEERLQQRIELQSRKSKPEGKIIHMLKPVLWLAAGLVLVFLLINYPLKKVLPDYSSETSFADIENKISNEWLYDDNLYDVIMQDTVVVPVDNEDMTDYLSAELSEYEIYSEMYN